MELKRGMKLTAVVSALLLGFALTAQAESFKTRHTYDLQSKGQVATVGHLPAEQTMQIDVVLPISDQAGLDAFLAKVQDPTSPSYGHFLTPAQFKALYAPSQQDYDATVRYLQTHGLTVVGGSSNRMDIQARGPVSAVESAFHVQMLTYQHPVEDRTFFAPDREPSTDLPFALWHVSGLDNFTIPKTALARSTPLKGSVKPGTSTGSGPHYSFLGSDMRAAYCSDCTHHGYGQDMALLEYQGTDLQDVEIYFHNVDQEMSNHIYLLSTDGTPLACTYKRFDNFCDDTEPTIDITNALGMAPALHSLTLYVGSTDTAIFSKLTSPPEGYDLPLTISSSWVWGNVDPTTLLPYFNAMASQGQTYFNASGDWSTWSQYNVPAWPADSPYVTAVGGTDLSTNGPGGTWKSETAWADSGGGVSPDGFAIPAWQQLPGVINESNNGSTEYRNGPDVSANANFTYYVCADLLPCTMNEYGGTSFAAPLWAAFITLVNEQSFDFGGHAIGSLNPLIYSANQGLIPADNAVYENTFHDVLTGSQANTGLTAPYSAVAGYDLVTGWGSMIGLGFICEYYSFEIVTAKPGAKPLECCDEC